MRLVFLALAAIASPLAGQPRPVVDSLVDRITQHWGPVPHGGWRREWTVVRGDTGSLRAANAEISGSDRGGVYTVTMRAARFAAPILVARLHVGSARDEVVSARTVARGTVLGDGDVLLRHTVIWGAPVSGAVLPMSAVIGAEARRVLPDGEPIRTSDIAAAPVVFAGDSVVAEVIRDGVRLALVGTALHNAPLGARVTIRLDRGRRLAGVATGRNTVRLD